MGLSSIFNPIVRAYFGGEGGSEPNWIKVELNNRVLSGDYGSIIVKVADEPFRTDPNVPIELTRIGGIQFAASPWLNYNGTDGSKASQQEEFLNAFECCKTLWSIELGEGTFDDFLDEGYEAVYMNDPTGNGDEYFIRVPEEVQNFYGTDVTLPKGLYIHSTILCYPSSFEVLPPE